jgi:excisionase family DNA binding protein
VTVVVLDDMPNRGWGGAAALKVTTLKPKFCERWRTDGAGGERSRLTCMLPEWEGSFPTIYERTRSVRSPDATLSPAAESQGRGGATVPYYEPFIGKAELARRIGKSERTVEKWMRRAVMPYYKIGRSVSFKWTEVESALAKYHRL